MDLLRGLVIGDPSREAAEHLAGRCDRLAEERLVATTGEETLSLVAEHKPEMVVLSLELTKPDAQDVVKKLTKQYPSLFIVATFRELTVGQMDKIGRMGVDDFMPQPMDLTQLFRAASTRFDKPFRRHNRYQTAVDVMRADGVMIGKTQDISEGGMMMNAIHPVNEDDSVLVTLALPGFEDAPIKVRAQVLAVDGEAPQAVSARLRFENLRGEEFRRLSDYLTGLSKDSSDS